MTVYRNKKLWKFWNSRVKFWLKMYGGPSGFNKFGVKNILDLILDKLIFSKYLAKICIRTSASCYVGKLLHRRVVTVGESTSASWPFGESTSASWRRRVAVGEMSVFVTFTTNSLSWSAFACGCNYDYDFYFWLTMIILMLITCMCWRMT